MSHSADHLTGNCGVASVLRFGAIYRSRAEAGAEDADVTSVTGEGLNCGRGDEKKIGNCKEELFFGCQSIKHLSYTESSKVKSVASNMSLHFVPPLSNKHL